MAKLLMFQGLPASGKSTRAKELEQLGWVVVTKDDIRAELEAGGWEWSRDKEREVLNVRNGRIEDALKEGKNVVSADTNFARVHKTVLREIAHRQGAEFDTQRFDVTVEECIRRNELRTGKAKVPIEAITSMYKQYVEGDPDHFPLSAKRVIEFEKVRWYPSLPTGVISDLDGTLALYEHLNHRGHYDASRCELDEVCKPVRELLNLYEDDGVNIIYLTGREEIYRTPTQLFLENNGCPPGILLMRAKGDTRKDTLVKHELFNQYVRGKYNISFAIEDRPRVVRMWRKLGIFTLAVGDLEDF